MDQQLATIREILAGADSQGMQQLGLLPFLFLLAVSLASSFLIAWLYTRFYSSRATGSQVHRAFPLLGISITAIFVSIQFSLPLSLGLLGALSIVRFRTPIKEPEEIGFLMLVIASAIAAATYKVAFLGLLILVAVVALLLQQVRRQGLRIENGLIVVATRGGEQGTAIEGVTSRVTEYVPDARLESLSQSADQIVYSFTFQRGHPQKLEQLQQAMRQDSGVSLNIYFSRPGGL
ncbi:MAG TPA: DUF4956 domain-containing protein [Vicinamibacterales bacterium]